MINILLVYCVTPQTALMKSIQENVSDQQLSIDLLDIDNWQLHSISTKHLHHNWYGKILRNKSNTLIWNYFIKQTHKLFDRLFLKGLFAQYDIIDFHYFSDLYFPLFKLANSLNKKIKITLWGSDLLRLNEKEKIEHCQGYSLAERIQVATPYMFNTLCSSYEGAKFKTVILPFGNQKLDYIKAHYDDNLDCSFLPNYDNSKIIVVCGYNGSESQRHLDMINMLNNLSAKILERLYVVFPMTYGASHNYINRVSECLNRHSYLYDVITSRMSDIQVFTLRKIADVVINVQKTDAFSGSIQEHVYCGNVMILGDWLPYDIMKDAGINYVPTSMNELRSTFLSVINNLSTHKDNCKMNRELIYSLTSWQNLRNRWKEVYNKM